MSLDIEIYRKTSKTSLDTKIYRKTSKIKDVVKNPAYAKQGER
ncbi:MAG: hypothetical protein RRY78_06165 [Clostridia bacterium]